MADPVAKADGLYRRGHHTRRATAASRARPATAAFRDGAGATVLRGIWGLTGDHKPHGDKVFQVARGGFPVTTIIVDTPDSIARSFDIVDELTQRDGLVTSEMVPAVLSLDETQRFGDITLAQHDY